MEHGNTGSQNKKWWLLIPADKLLYGALVSVNTYKHNKFQPPSSISFRGMKESQSIKQEAQLSLTNHACGFVKLLRLQDVLSEYADKKFTTDYNVA